MTTFKNNAKYAELLMSYLDLTELGDVPLKAEKVLSVMRWRFKGGSLKEAAEKTRLQPETSESVFPDGDSLELSKHWGRSRDCLALEAIVRRRSRSKKRRAADALLGTWLLLTSSYGSVTDRNEIRVYSGMRSVYYLFRLVWADARDLAQDPDWDLLTQYTRELTLGACAVANVDLPTVEARIQEYRRLLDASRVSGLLTVIKQLKDLMRCMGSRLSKAQARTMGRDERQKWETRVYQEDFMEIELSDLGWDVLCQTMPLGSRTVRVCQEVVLLGTGPTRHALSKSDLERLHQLVMSTASCLVGVVAQAALGTALQKAMAKRAVVVTEENIERLASSSARVPLGDEVLVCKGYRRAYTAHLGWLAGRLCVEETEVLLREAEETAPPGVLDILGYCESLRTLDAASSLNAGKVFKICPAPDVSPGGAMLDRVVQIGNCNTFDPEMKEAFTHELTSQILRAHVRNPSVRLKLRDVANVPSWWESYRRRKFDEVPTAELSEYLAWEASGEMPAVSAYDPGNWKDSGLGADSIVEAEAHEELGHKKNMLTRLLFDPECPMPGKQRLSDEHVIKFFVKAEGHKDPARGIFSANLTDRQAQSWMEKAVESVAKRHPSFMIGAEADAKDMKVKQLTAKPKRHGWVALYYSFDISGWSAKMPGEPQSISHGIWAKLFGGHLFNRACAINEGAHIYLNLDGYVGWYKNTKANLEGFNGKEMTMILVTLLSLSVRVWRKEVVEAGLLTEREAMDTVALLFAYIDDGLSRIDLPASKALAAFDCYKKCVIETFSRCGFTVETSKCFPSDRFSIFLNEVYIGGRHCVHGVRAAMGISSEPTERHTTLVERVTSVSTGCRGAVMAGLTPLSAVFLMAYHSLLHLLEWCEERDPTVLAIWGLSPRAWGGLGMPNLCQLSVSGSGSAFEEGVATMQRYSRVNNTVKAYFIHLCKSPLEDRTEASILTAPLSSRVTKGYMRDSRVAAMVRDALRVKRDNGLLSPYAERLLRYGDTKGFSEFAEAIIHTGEKEVIQEQMLANVYEAHPHSIFSTFARRIEKSVTVSSILGPNAFRNLLVSNRQEAMESVAEVRCRLSAPIA